MSTSLVETKLNSVQFAPGYRHIKIELEDIGFVMLSKEDVKTLTKAIMKMYKCAHANRIDDPIDMEDDENKEDSFKLLMKELGIIR